ncbi:hypothetical protein LOC67_13585 [Stieleria sp. JC731]|uniref:HisA/HisF-related TIM barrel protein n=1 Tax=Pirellulaceae TaxID=2691357 RepID=UPI001E3F3567|nr:HisA/HisF-related TIM barrel protein [Stieleria sp. JC731]MCC9601584.1 hypothetical protein [Stieleria sp. JC731]
MKPTSSLHWDPGLWQRLVGVVDLKGGESVHAIAGDRACYRATQVFRHPGGKSVAINGDAALHAIQYKAAKFRSIYVADLDALTDGSVQSETIAALVDRVGAQVDWLLDLGIKDSCDAIPVALQDHPSTSFVLASESVVDLDLVATCAKRFGQTRVAISLDFRNRQWMSAGPELDDWIRSIERNDIRSVIALDLGGVGTGNVDAATRLIRSIRKRLPKQTLISGGGVSGERDADRLVAAGADRILVASLFTGAASPFVSSD